MAQIIKLKRSLSSGNKPTTSDLSIGEIALNVYDGRVFLRKSGSLVGDSITEFVTLDHEGTLTGSLNISGSITASYFVGDGSQLTNLSIAQTATVKQSFTNESTWVVNHNLDTINAIAQVYDNNDYQIIPSTLRQTDSNTITVTFESNRSGYVVVAKGGHIVSGSIDAENISGLSTSVVSLIHAEGVFSQSAQITLSGDVTGTANSTIISQIDGGSV